MFLAHWKESECEERVGHLERAGFRVEGWAHDGGAASRALRAKAPDAVVIDLGRLPSHGRQLGNWLRENARTRHIPIVFVEGDPDKSARLRRDLPDAVFAKTWRGVRSAVERAISSPPADPVVPRRPDYSGTPLAQKLGIKDGSRVALLAAPPDFPQLLDPLPAGVHFQTRVGKTCDVMLLFVKSRSDLMRRLPPAVRALQAGHGLWVAWPKKSSDIPTDLDQGTVQRAGLDLGVVDNKICAIDANWSGQRFAVRRSPKKAPRIRR